MAFAVLTVVACLGMASAYYPSSYGYGPYGSYGSSYGPYSSGYSYGYGSAYPYFRSLDDFGMAPWYYSRQEPVAAPAPVEHEAPKKTYAVPVAAPVHVETHAASPHPCPGYYPEIKPIVVKSEKPVPFTYGLPLTPKVIEHHSAPNVLNYYQSPYIVKHQQSAVLHAFTQKPVVIDSYEHPSVYEEYGPQAVIVEEVCPEVPHPVAVAPAPVAAPQYAPPPHSY